MRPRDLLTNAALALVFAGVYIACYVYFLNYWFEYLGFVLQRRDASFFTVSIAAAVLPILCYGGQRAASSAVSVFVYLLLYVPIVLTFTLASDRPLGEIALVQFALMGCMSALFLSDRVIVRTPVDLHLGINLAPWICVATVAATAYIVVIYRGHFRWASFGDDVYVQRFATESLGTGLVTRYLSSWLSSLLIPLCLAHGLSTRRRSYFVVGTVASVIVYMGSAAKIAILLPPVYLALFLVFSKGRIMSLFPLLAGGLSAVLLLLLAIVRQGDGLVFVMSSLLMYRTIGNAGQLTLAYYEFFRIHPQTLYSHIHGWREISGAYPYGQRELGQVVGQFYWSPDMNANANFWATDGFAALGTPGLVFATGAAIVWLAIMNSVTRGYDRLFVVLCLLPFLVAILNTSLFSSIWSGGALFLSLFFLFNARNLESHRGVELPIGP